MAEPTSLLALVNAVAEVCGTTGVALCELGSQVTTSRSILSAMSAELLTTKQVFGRLETFLDPSAQGGHLESEQRQDFIACFEVFVQAINQTVLDLDVDIRRLRRYSSAGDPLALSKAVPILQDSLFDARHSLRRNNASMALMLDCLKSGNLEEATILFPSATDDPCEKAADPLRLQPQIAITLTKQSLKPNVQALMAKIRPKHSRSYKIESRIIKKLHEGITNGDYNTVYKCLADRADPNALARGSKIAPIHQALTQTEAALACEDEVASRELLAIVSSLVLAGADLKVPDEQGCTPLIRVVKGEMGDSLAALMLEQGARVNAVDRELNTALHYAAMQTSSPLFGNQDLIRILLVHGADQSLRNERGRTPLYKAVMWGRAGRARELLDYGGDMEAIDHEGWSVLFGAVLKGNVELTEELCKRGAGVDRRDRSGQTTLHYSVSQNRREVVEVLVAAGADVNLLSKGETPLCRAVSKGSLDLVKYLIEHGADVKVPSPGYGGAVPLHLAAIGKSRSILTALLEAGSPTDVSDEMGRTPIDWAKEGGRGEMVELLWQGGARAEALKS